MEVEQAFRTVAEFICMKTRNKEMPLAQARAHAYRVLDEAMISYLEEQGKTPQERAAWMNLPYLTWSKLEIKFNAQRRLAIKHNHPRVLTQKGIQ